MANKSFKKKKIQDTQGSGFGSYQEDVGGGGSPNPRDPNQKGPGVNSQYRQNNNDTMQPRTGDGKFTYKSVNGQSIDPKYGPSRGKTVNPLLTGGQNGVMIDDVEGQFAGQSGVYWDKYKDKWYRKGGEIVTTDFKVRVAADAIWEVAKRRYDSVKGEFQRESDVFAETKKGRPGAEERRAKQVVANTWEEAPVISQSSGGIKMKPGVQVQPPVPQQPTPGQTGAQPPVIPVGGNAGSQAGAGIQAGAGMSGILNADYTPKYGDDDIAQARSLLQQMGMSASDLAAFDSLSPKEKDSYIDQYFTSDEEEEAEGEPDNAPAPEAEAKPESKPEEEEEESEETKKVRKMGFTDGGK